jgi:nucleotide-binding universal stress UspA family protein/quercetin dioxygenase-like cupin family protein
MDPFHHILVATDFGPSSQHAVRLAAELAQKHNAKLTLMHVIDGSYAEPETLVPLTSASEPAEWERRAREQLGDLADELTTRAGIVLRHGDAAKSIVDEAQNEDCDLVVLGTHGRHGAAKWLFGSVAERVVRECKRPVLTVHGGSAHAVRSSSEPVETPRVDVPERRHDSTVIKIDSASSPVGEDGQTYLASGVRTSMRLWKHEPIGVSAETERDYEVVGYVIGGQAELHVEGQTVRLEPGDSYVVPRHARHHYRVLAPLTVLEATSPPAQVHARDTRRAV